MVLPYAQGLAEISVSDANKLHLTTVPEVIDSLRVWVGVSADATSAAATAPVDVAYLGKLRAYACSALAQLAASPVTLPMLLGHPLLDDLEQVPALPDSSKDARNDAMAAIFAVRLHEKAIDDYLFYFEDFVDGNAAAEACMRASLWTLLCGGELPPRGEMPRRPEAATSCACRFANAKQLRGAHTRA